MLDGSLPLSSLLLNLLPLLLALLSQGPLLGLRRQEKHQASTFDCTTACGKHASTLQTAAPAVTWTRSDADSASAEADTQRLLHALSTTYVCAVVLHVATPITRHFCIPLLAGSELRTHATG